MRDLEKVIGRVVAARRRQLGLSQEALAEATGLVASIERELTRPSKPKTSPAKARVPRRGGTRSALGK